MWIYKKLLNLIMKGERKQMESTIKYKFLENIPIGEDLFEGKSQEKIAEVIKDSIENNNFQIFGIDGGWGTGKSNLIKIVEKKLNPEKYIFFLYDVWGHQEDEAKKSILIELSEFLIATKKLKNTIKLKKDIKVLLSKKREITTINVPYLSIGIILSLFSIVYTPAAKMFEKYFLNDKVPITKPKLYISAILVFLPIILIGIIYIYNYLKFFFLKRFRFLESFKYALQDTFQIYTNKQKQETKIENISEDETSVGEFRKWMKGIDKILKKNDKKLIIVFDNFDRLPKKHIQSVWALIHTFFSDEKYENLKVILPFDREHIKYAFSELNSGNKNEILNFANDYINKTFDLVFRIAPPIMSNWKIFFKICWDRAFDIESLETEEKSRLKNEYIRVERTYEAFSKNITPREIISFINEVLTLKILHNNIPEKYIALFIMNKEEILKNPLEAIINHKFLKGLSYLYQEEEEFQKYITALSYQIDSKNSLEVAYISQLKNCLMNNENLQKLKEISKTTVFSKIIGGIIDELENLENPIIALDSLDEEAKISEDEKNILWNDIYSKVKKNINLDILFPTYKKILFTKINLKNKKEWLKNFSEATVIKGGSINPLEYSSVIDEYEELIEKNKFQLNIYEYIKEIKVESGEFLTLVEEKKEEYKKYKILTNKEKIDEYLSKLDINMLRGIEYIKYFVNDYKDDKFNFNLLRNNLNTLINSNRNNKNNLGILINLLNIINGNVKEENSNLVLNDPEIYSLTTQSNEKEDFFYELIAMRLARGTKFSSDINYFLQFLNKNNIDMVTKISSKIQFYITYGELLINSIVFKFPLVEKIIKELTINTNNDPQYIIFDKVIEKFDEICKANDLNPQELINHLSKYEKTEFSKEIINKTSNNYFEEAMKNESSLAKESIESLRKYFDNLSVDEWKKIFTNLQTGKYKLIEVIQYSNWKSNSLEALKDILKTLSKETNIKNEIELNELILKFEKDNKFLNNTFKDIRDEFIRNGNMNEKLFSFFGAWLFKYGDLQNKKIAGEVIRTILKSSLLSNKNCVDIMLENKNILKDIFKNSENEDTADFIHVLKERKNEEKIKNY